MGWTLGRYFFFRYATITLWFFVGVFALIFLIDFTEFSSRTSGLPGFTIETALTVSAFRVPMVMLQTVPFVGLFAAMATLVSLNRKYELVIARAAGISAWQFLLPACFGAFVFGVIAVGILNPIAAAGFSRSEVLESEMRSGKSNAISAFSIPWIRQKTIEGDTIIGARAVLRPEFVQERLARPETIPFYDLPAKIEIARSFGLRANAFAMQFQSLLALPMLLIAMTLIAATVSMRFARMGQSATMILGGIFAGFLLYVVTVLVKAFGNAGFVPPYVAAWLPVVVAMFFGVTFLLYKEDG
jgi:lipopolysaccharide export system permease protein